MREELFVLQPVSTVESIAVIRREMLKHFSRAAKGGTVIVDMSRLERWDTSLGQLLVAAKLLAGQKKLDFVLDGIGERVNLETMLCCDAIREPSVTDAYGEAEAGNE